MNWSKYQQAIYEAFEHSGDSLLVEAVAGSGKTSTLVELANIMQRAFPEQRAVFVAFNKSIADELARRISATNVRAMTLHSAGWSAWRRAGGLEWEPRVDSHKVSGIMREALSYEENKRFGDSTRKLVGYAKGIGLVPIVPGTEGYGGLATDQDSTWEGLIDHYGLDEAECNIPLVRKVLARSIELSRETCDFDDMLYMPVIAGVPFDQYDVVLVDEAQDVSGIQMEMISRMVKPRGRVIAVGDRKQSIYGFRGAGTESMDILQRRFQMRPLPLSVSYRCPVAVVEYARQWVPQIEHREDAPWGYVGLEGTDWAGQAEVALGAPLVHSKYAPNAPDNAPPKTVMVDRRKLEQWQRDPRARYLEFHESIERTDYERVNDPSDSDTGTGSGVCAGDMDIQQNPDTEVGITKWRGISDFLPGDAILCRLTRPVVAAAFALIRRRVACHVLGRDIGKGLVDLVRKAKSLQAGTVEAFGKWLDDYEAKESARLYSKNKAAQAGLLGDKCDTIRVFMEQLAPDASVTMLTTAIQLLFADDGNGQSLVTLATVHKAKGLQWPRVFILDAGELMPCRWARQRWELAQELNIQYVAATRAMHELRYIKSSDLGVG